MLINTIYKKTGGCMTMAIILLIVMVVFGLWATNDLMED